MNVRNILWLIQIPSQKAVFFLNLAPSPRISSYTTAFFSFFTRRLENIVKKGKTMLYMTVMSYSLNLTPVLDWLIRKERNSVDESDL